MFLGLPDPDPHDFGPPGSDPDPLVKGMDPDPDLAVDSDPVAVDPDPDPALDPDPSFSSK
jgi:hypothetical protein